MSDTLTLAVAVALVVTVTEKCFFFFFFFFAGDVESFINEYGLLPEREMHHLEQTNMEDEDAE
ncbi:phosducin [Microtus ochrogaster]|uniref:Phosducin n=1 Tax=Microtus ochrogaster TaxID=79684 RepID=A0A8J6G8U9_MICOH|nr:phosducin [Microtus ochrogaster]